MNRSPGEEHYSEAEWLALICDCQPTGAELRRVRLELRSLLLIHCPELANNVVVPSSPPSLPACLKIRPKSPPPG